MKKTTGLRDAYEVDEDLARDGIKFQLDVAGQNAGWIKMRPADADINPEYRVAILRMGQQIAAWHKKNPGKDLADDQPADRRFLAEAYADAIVTDWEVFGPDGNQLPCERDVVIEELVAMPKLFSTLQRMAKQWANYRRSFEDAAVKP